MEIIFFQRFKSAKICFENDIEFKPFGGQAGSPCVGLSAPFNFTSLMILILLLEF
jgi:hypothetical protein